MNNAPFLRSLALPRPLPGDGYPFDVETIASLNEIAFTSPVTFFAGGNGTGKSTVLEAVAGASGRILVRGGSADDWAFREPPAGSLGAHSKLTWTRFTKKGFFLRAEDFLGYKRHLSAQMEELGRTAEGYAGRMEGYGLQLARGATLGQRDALVRRYGEDPDAMSHGESFLQFFRSRFTGPGLYLLDEPDTALSPQSVLGLVAALMEMARAGAQFIIATHNPILLAYPGAQLLSFDRAPIEVVSWEHLEQVTLMRDFLAHPAVYLRHLVADEMKDEAR